MSARNHKDTTNNQNTKKYLDKHLEKSVLRFLTCGSVDDGKSTLLGRLLFETKAVFSDQFAQLQLDSRKFGTQGNSIDYALLLDGLSAEQEQGITIDVAYRFFSTEKRKFIVADTPGHEQYTRNMATGASTADAAVILIDAARSYLSFSDLIVLLIFNTAVFRPAKERLHPPLLKIGFGKSYFSGLPFLAKISI